jgi:hypothetical protein
MHWRDKVAKGLVAKLRVTQPIEVNTQFADFFITGLLILMAIGGLAM